MEYLKRIVESLDTSRKGGYWKRDLLKKLSAHEEMDKTTPILLTEKDVASVIQYNHTFRRKPKKYTKILQDLLKEQPGFRTGMSDGYNRLCNFLLKTGGSTLSSHRRIYYAVMPLS